LAPLPGLNKGVFQDPSPPLVDSVLSPIAIPNGTTLVTTKTTNETIANVDELIDYVSGDNGPNFIPQAAIDSLVSDLALKEDAANKGAISGYAGLDASQELLLANFPSGTALQILRRNAGNTALEFFTLSDLQGITSINADTTAAQILAGTINRISLVDAGDTHTFDIDAAYVGQASITTLGTITTGVWNGTDITLANIVNGTADQIIKTNSGGTALEFGLIGDANTDTFTTTKISTTSKSLLNSAIVYNDQANTYSGAADQDFVGSALRHFDFIESNGTNTPSTSTIRLGERETLGWAASGDTPSFGYNLDEGLFTFSADVTLSFEPAVRFLQTGLSPPSNHLLASIFFTSKNSVGDNREFVIISVRSENNTDSAEEGSYTINVSEAGFFIPYLQLNSAGNNLVDIFRDLDMNNNDVLLGTGQITVDSGTLGDLYKYDATGFSRFALGAADNVLKVNAGGTDLEYGLITNANIVVGAEIDVAKLADGNSGQFIRTDAAGTGVEYADDIFTINFVIDGGGTTITTGIKGTITVDFNCEVIEWAVTADQSGDIVVDVNRSTFAGYPTTSSIAGTELPTITTSTKGEDRTITTWSTIATGNVLEFEVDSITTIQRATVSIVCRKTG